MDILRRIALILVIIGAINWGLIGFFNYDLVAAIFGGQQSVIARIIYSLVGISGLYALTIFFTGLDEPDDDRVRTVRPDYRTEFGSDFESYTKQRDETSKKEGD